MSEPFRLVAPAPVWLPAYRDALERGWSPNNIEGWAAALRELDWIDRDAQSFLLSLDDPQARGAPILLPDGTSQPRLPSLRRWMWDGTFCGSVSLRWQKGTSALPAHVLGHISFSVVPWKRGNGYAARALAAILPCARAVGLSHVEITASLNNVASQKTIERCGGRLIERFCDQAWHDGTEILRYRIELT